MKSIIKYTDNNNYSSFKEKQPQTSNMMVMLSRRRNTKACKRVCERYKGVDEAGKKSCN